jgi:hypothetical protein
VKPAHRTAKEAHSAWFRTVFRCALRTLRCALCASFAVRYAPCAVRFLWMLLAATGIMAARAPARAEEPLWGETASTLGKGFVDVTTRGDLLVSKPYLHHGGPSKLTIERTDVLMDAGYGLLPDLDLHLRVPYFTESLDVKFGGQSVSNPLSGLGELEAGAKWRFRQWVGERRKDELAVMTDLKLPTGKHDYRDASGAVIPGHLQPNSGSLGGALGLAANRHTLWGRYWCSTMLGGEIGTHRYHRGSMFQLHASAGSRWKRLAQPEQTDWLGIIGLHYYLMGKDEEDGKTVRDSGGSVLGAELGLTGSTQTWSGRLGVLLPVWTDLGKAHAPPRYELQASLRRSF